MCDAHGLPSSSVLGGGGERWKSKAEAHVDLLVRGWEGGAGHRGG